MTNAKDIKSLKKVLLQTKQKGYKKLETKNEGYSRAHQKKKIKRKNNSMPLTYPEAIGFQW